MSTRVGDVVHYVLPSGPYVGECRAAIVIRVSDPANEIVELQVFLRDMLDDGRAKDHDRQLRARRAVSLAVGTWHEREHCHH